MTENKDSEQTKVVPMHFCIEEKDVEKQYDCDSFCIYKAGGFMHYMTKGGYHVFVKPDYKSLYETLEMLLDCLITADGRTEDEKQFMHDIADVVSSIIFAPTMLFCDEDITLEAYNHIQEFIKRMYDKAKSKLSNEDFDANNDFESAVKSAEELLENLKGIADALPEENNEQ